MAKRKTGQSARLVARYRTKQRHDIAEATDVAARTTQKRGWQATEEILPRVDVTMRAAGFRPGTFSVAGIFAVEGTLLDLLTRDVFDPGGILVVVEHRPDDAGIPHQSQADRDRLQAELLDVNCPHLETRVVLMGFPGATCELWILGSARTEARKEGNQWASYQRNCLRAPASEG